MGTPRQSWAIDRPISSPFAVPVGVRGRLAGRFMLWTNKQDEVLRTLAVRPGDQVLEIGYGPGGLLRLLTACTDAALIHGVDPSPEMRDLAARTNRAAVRAGRVRLHLGEAADLGLPDQSVDRVVSVNNVAIWPDLEPGLRELRRVLQPGGTAVVAWHGGTSPSRIARSLRLPEDKLARIEDGLKELFSDVALHRLTTLDAFKAI
jgi:SAM-dependent methyltransferase